MSTRHRPCPSRPSPQCLPSPKPTARDRRCTSGQAVLWGHWICIQMDRLLLWIMLLRPPSTDPSVFGGLLCFCPSGHSYGAHMGALKVARKVCRRPCASNPAHFRPFLLYLTLVCPAVCVYAGASERAWAGGAGAGVRACLASMRGVRGTVLAALAWRAGAPAAEIQCPRATAVNRALPWQ